MKKILKTWSNGKQIGCCTPKLPATIDLFGRTCCWCNPIVFRLAIFFWAAATIAWSMATFWSSLDLWMLYMTHWGLLLILFESFFGVLVSCGAYRQKGYEETNAPTKLPLYVTIYWTLYNTAIPVAFLITVFYWVVLKGSTAGTRYDPDPALDMFLHTINSVVMAVELLISAHPSRLIHIYQPLFFGGFYVTFGCIYYFSGGVDPWGNVYIYPVIDWSRPEQTLVVVALTGLYLGLMHLVVVLVATIRDTVSNICCPLSEIFCKFEYFKCCP